MKALAAVLLARVFMPVCKLQLFKRIWYRDVVLLA